MTTRSTGLFRYARWPRMAFQAKRNGQERKEKTARMKVRNRTRNEDRKANPAPGPM